MKRVAKRVFDKRKGRVSKKLVRSISYVDKLASKIESFLSKTFAKKSREVFCKSKAEERTMLNTSRNNQKFWILVLTILSPIFMLELRSYNQLKKQNMRIINTLAILPNKIVNIGSAKFYVPNYPIDLIQSEIVENSTFYEIDLLIELQPYIKKNAVILDIGANIGNHSVYWAVRSYAKKIYSFEPVEDFFKILKKNIEINQLNDKVKIFNIGLSNQKINGSILEYHRDNIGETRIKQDSNGNLMLDRLDNITFEDNTIDFIKIDVEGHELEVLQGARETLLKYRPVVFVEISSENKTKVHEYLTKLGYRLEKRFRNSNYLYIFNETK